MRWIAAVALAFAMSASAQTMTVVPPPSPQQPAVQQPVEVPSYVLADRIARARENFVALREGRRSVAELTPAELQDVIAYDRKLSGGLVLDGRSYRERCIDSEVKRAGGKPSELEWAVIRLKCRN